ncbi:MAG: diacylglycerol kinase family protein [Pseudomonadota bacterium]
MKTESEGEGAPTPRARRSALVFFNPKAGGTHEADRAKLLEALEADSVDVQDVLDVDQIEAKTLRAARACDFIIVLGGDGTARAAAEHASLNGPPLILLPGGTLNLLPHVLYGERNWPDALHEALERGVVRRLAGGWANHHRFFIAAIFGAPTLLARAREAVREGRLLSAWRGARHFFKRAFTYDLTVRPDGGCRAKAEAVGVLAPSFGGAVEGPDLEWVRLDAHQLIDLARVGVRALGKGWREDSAVEIVRCKRGDVSSSGVIPAVLDGEPKTFLGKVRIRYDALGPRVIALEDT